MLNLLKNIENCNYRDNIGELINHPDYINLKQQLAVELKDTEVDVSSCSSILLLDLENVNSEVDKELLKQYDVVYMFYSHNHVKFATEISQELIKYNIKYIPLMFIERNGIDHLLSFFLGMLLHKINNNTQIHIYSQDKGFNNLINYFNLLNISRDIVCRRVIPTGENINELTKIYNKIPRFHNCPKNKNSLLNHLHHLSGDYEKAKEILKQLIINNYIIVNNKGIVNYLYGG